MQGVRSWSWNEDWEPQLHPGEVIWASVVNGIENRHASGKFRPCVIVEAPQYGCLTVVGLTSKGLTKKGDRRLQLVDSQDWGLRGQSYVYGRQLTRLARIDVAEHLGWLSNEDAEAIADVYHLASDWTAIDEIVVS